VARGEEEVIALDTNVLLRTLVEDDAHQVEAARRLVRALEERGERAYVSDVVLVELAWVLRANFGHPREQIALAMRQLLASDELRFDAPETALRALEAYEAGPGDFSDYMTREHAHAAGCTTVATFDRKLHKDEMFSAP
jgi:predicted nucleic-acid-binding protein